MKVLDESTLIFMEGAYGYSGMQQLLQLVKSRCEGVEQIAVVVRKTSANREDRTWIFKGTNGKREVLTTYTEWLTAEQAGYSWTANVTMDAEGNVSVTS